MVKQVRQITTEEEIDGGNAKEPYSSSARLEDRSSPSTTYSRAIQELVLLILSREGRGNLFLPR